MLTGTMGSSFGFAVAAGGKIDLNGGPKEIHGNVKSNGRIELQGKTEVLPLDGNGRVLSADSMEVKGNFQMDSSQDIRARANIQGKVRGTEQKFPFDTSEATLPFINDGRMDDQLAAGEQGDVLPNPDPAVLLSGPDLVTWAGVTSLTLLNLDDKTHYFPDGIRLDKIQGTGTVVVGNGNRLEVGSDVSGKINLIVLDPGGRGSGGSGSGGAGGSLQLNRKSHLEGLVYAHGNVETKGDFDLKGVLVSYKGDIKTKKANIEYDASAFGAVSGFEPWVRRAGGNPSGSGTLKVVSWQRL